MTESIDPINPEKKNPPLKKTDLSAQSAKPFNTMAPLEKQLVTQYGPEGKKLYTMIMKSIALNIINQMKENEKNIKKAMENMRKNQ